MIEKVFAFSLCSNEKASFLPANGSPIHQDCEKGVGDESPPMYYKGGVEDAVQPFDRVFPRPKSCAHPGYGHREDVPADGGVSRDTTYCGTYLEQCCVQSTGRWFSCLSLLLDNAIAAYLCIEARSGRRQTERMESRGSSRRTTPHKRFFCF